MKRVAKIGMVALCAVTLFGFSSCNKKKAADEKITLTVWESTNGPDEFIKQAGEAFTKTHPNVVIKY